MDENVMMGGVIGIVGEENFSATARAVMATYRKGYLSAEVLPATSIAVYNDGSVLEVVHIFLSMGKVHTIVSILNERVVDIDARTPETPWTTMPLSILSLLSWDYADHNEYRSTMEFLDRIESSFGSEERQDELLLIEEMIADSDRYPTIPDDVWERHSKLSI